jgi:hypothetical protein
MWRFQYRQPTYLHGQFNSQGNTAVGSNPKFTDCHGCNLLKAQECLSVSNLMHSYRYQLSYVSFTLLVHAASPSKWL